MKFLKILSMLIVLITITLITKQKTFAQRGPDSYQVFYDNLSPYGEWVDYSNYGYVWIPDVDEGFTPYGSNGHWVYTDEGWTWVSGYPWGWAAFHYGRWENDNTYGWFWVPDNEWGPAWVSWRRSSGYYGWAPLRPGISISVSFGSGYHEQDDRWIFVRDRDINRSDISRRYLDRDRNITIINNSTVIINERRDDRRKSTYIAGPDRNDVQRVTHSQIKPVAIREDDKPGQQLNKGELKIYRPEVQKINAAGRKPAPSKIVKLADIKPIAQRSAGNQQKGINPVNNNGRQPQNINPNNRGQQPQNTAPSGNRTKQPQNNAPSNNRTKQPQNVTPTDNRTRPPQNVAPSNNRAKQPQNVAPTDNRARQPQNTAPSNNRPNHPQNMAPTDNRTRPQQNTAPSNNKAKPPQSVAPSNNRAKQPQKENPPRPNQTKQDEKKKDT